MKHLHDSSDPYECTVYCEEVSPPPDARFFSALTMIQRHARRPRPADRPLRRKEDLNAVDISIAKAAARRLRGRI